jgi:hypothetical protein
MTDIMQDWKDRRFVVADRALGFEDTVVVLTDYQYWANHVDELIEWCRATPGITNEGMTVICRDERSLTLFLLRWS